MLVACYEDDQEGCWGAYFLPCLSVIEIVSQSFKFPGQGKVVSAEYVLLPGDLREVDEVMRDLEGVGFRTELPTLIIAECVLVYMPPDTAQRLVSELGRRLPTAAFLVYEQVAS